MPKDMPPLPMPPLPKTPRATMSMPSLPATPVAGSSATGFTAEFLRNPLQFMRRHSMSPPHGSGSSWTNDDGTSAATSQAPASHFKSDINEGVFGATIERRTGAGGIRLAQIIKHTDPNFPGATGLKIAADGATVDTSWIPIYFLPWKSLKILSYTIPSVPQSLAEWDDEEYPRFFFTAGINGCSVFASGDSRGPTISHAGLDAALSRSAGEFWRMQMAKTKSGYSAEAIRGEVNTHDYMFKGMGAKRLADQYQSFLSSDKGDFTIEVQSPFGCVFGIRYGRAWTLYLQKSVVFNKVRFYKASQVDAVARGNQTDYFAKGTGLLAREEKKMVQNHLGKLPLPGKKEVKIYSTAQRFSLPLEVLEMYPNRKAVGDLKDAFKSF